MKQLATIVFASLLIGCGGCESTPPAPVEIPAITAPVKQTPVEKTKFVKGDLVTVTSPDGKTQVQGVVEDVGPLVLWLNPVTNKNIESRAYRIKVVVNGKDQIGVAPEFALTKRSN